MGLLGGQAKAMVVTSSRKEAVRYKQAFDKYVAEQNYANIKRWWHFRVKSNLLTMMLTAVIWSGRNLLKAI
jgi:hypothetical protein